jgi:hypothetical protein
MISNPGRNGVALLGMLFVVSRLYGYADQITLGAYGYELWFVLLALSWWFLLQLVGCSKRFDWTIKAYSVSQM